MQVEFRPDGPHSPEYTREVADAAAEAIRTLNYATQQKDGLSYPSDVYDVVGRLSSVAGRQPQALHQMREWLHDEVREGRAREHGGGPHRGDTEAAYRAYAEHTAKAVAAAEELRRHLAAAQEALSGLTGTPKED